jgi:hypothetical protein
MREREGGEGVYVSGVFAWVTAYQMVSACSDLQVKHKSSSIYSTHSALHFQVACDCGSLTC